MNKALWVATLVVGGMASNAAMADVAVGVRAGTFGVGADFDIGLTDTVNLRLGYNTFSYDQTVEDTDVTYDGTLKIGAASAIIDWHVLGGGFRVSAGAVQKGPKIDVTGVPSGNNTYEINGRIYTATQIGSLQGTVEIGDSVAPYLGIGWGNTVDQDGRFTFLLDLGVIKTGTASASLDVLCGATVPTATCTQIRNDVNAEKAELEDALDDYPWYPVVSLGFAVRF
jgi:hypothetical protein